MSTKKWAKQPKKRIEEKDEEKQIMYDLNPISIYNCCIFNFADNLFHFMCFVPFVSYILLYTHFTKYSTCSEPRNSTNQNNEFSRQNEKRTTTARNEEKRKRG